MSPRVFPQSAIAVAAIALSSVVLGQERDRASIPERDKWNVADIYPSDAAWRSAKRSR